MRARITHCALIVLMSSSAAGQIISGNAMGAGSGLLEKLPAGTTFRSVAFSAIDGWAVDDHLAALAAFLKTCPRLLGGEPSLRDAVKPGKFLLSACRKAQLLDAADSSSARAFFEAEFQPVEILPATGSGFLTAYFEPEVEASLYRTEHFPVPVLSRPTDLVTIPQGETRPGIAPGFSAARVTSNGLEIYPDRGQIWKGALEGQGLEIAWLRDKTELFIIQVQGSARLRLPDGGATRLVYAGRNGHPYTSIGKILVDSGQIPLPDMSLERLMAWLRANPMRGRALMEKNRSYVFFARDDASPSEQGPIGGAGVPLTEGRSLAVDRAVWPYGLPVWISVSPLTPEGPRAPLDRLMIAQDTGSAIVGPARGDFYMGSGPKAGTRAGLVRDSMRFVVFVPKGDLP